MGRLPHPAAHRLYELAAARPAAPRHRVGRRRGAGPAAALRLSPQPPAQGVRQRRGRTGRDAGSADRGEPGRVFRGVSCLPVLSRLHRSRFRIRGGALGRGTVALLRLPAGPAAPSCRATGARGGVRRAAGGTPEPGGDPVRWRALPVLEHSDTVALRVGADPSYLYLVLDGGPALDSTRYVVGIETQRGSGGERTLPGVSEVTDVGFEFALVLNDTSDAQLLVASAYNPYLVPRSGAGPTALDAFYHWGATVERASTRSAWDSLFVTTNRWRIGRDERTYAARGVNRGRLR